VKYSVTYLKPKKKGTYSKQTVVFYRVEDAFDWETYVKSNGCKCTEIKPIFV